jgi:hypothetical protein
MTLQERKSLTRLLGLFLLFIGIYFLAQNISIVSSCHSNSCYSWSNIAAVGSALAIMGGVLSLFVFQRKAYSLGWILLGVGAVLVYLSNGMILKPPGLLTFIVSFTALAYGCQFLKRGKTIF